MTEDLIRITHASSEKYGASKYYYDNRGREYAGHCVIQRTLVGDGFFEWKGCREEVPAGKGMAFRHGEESSYGRSPGSHEDFSVEWIGFTGGNSIELLEMIRTRLGSVYEFPIRSEAYTRFGSLTNKVQGMRFRDRYEMAAEVYDFLMGMMRLADEMESEKDLASRALQIIRNEYGSPVNVQEIADRLGCSREHLTRVFSESMNETPANALRSMRLRYAAELLAISSMSIAEVAYRCGMPEVNTFFRAFKRAYGVGPREYREQR